MRANQQIIAGEILKWFPPVVQEKLIDDPEFVSHYGLQIDARVSFGNNELSFRRGELFAAIRAAYQTQQPVSITDDTGREFDLSGMLDSEELRATPLDGGSAHVLPPFWFLKTTPESRLRDFEAEVGRLRLRGYPVEDWRKRLVVELSDKDVDDLLEFLKNSLIDVGANIAGEIRTGSSKVATLVPPSPEYYLQLIGDTRSVQSLSDYVAGVGAHTAPQKNGAMDMHDFARALILCGHSSISEAIRAPALTDELVEYFVEVAEIGDRQSQVALVEVGFRLVAFDNRLAAPMLKIIKEIADENVSNADSRLRLTSSLVIFVDGELSRLGLFRAGPPFLRRAAAMAQAAMIETRLVTAGIDSSQFSEWATAGRGQRFFLQSLCDLRVEPRWLPDFVSPEHLRMEYLSRLAGAAGRHLDSIPDGDLKDFVAGDADGGLKKLLRFPLSFLPGPLEGANDSPAELPEELVLQLRELQQADVLEADSFAALVNSALVFKIRVEHTKIATDTLRRVKHQIARSGDSDKTFSLLSGLAVAAAVARDIELADEVQRLARVMRQRPGIAIESDALMRIGLMASASALSLDAWCDAVGRWFTELAFADDNDDLVPALHSHLHQLCIIVPELWRTCSRAEAAFAGRLGAAA
jgi:hypothetical protein